MTDGQLLLLILWLVYFTDCLAWLDRHSVMMSTWWGRKWKALAASPHFGSSSRGAVILNPFPPFGRFCLSRLLPLSITPDNVVAYNSQTVAEGGRPQQTGQTVCISDISRVGNRETELVINDEPFCDLRDHQTACHLARLLEQLRLVPTEKRPDMIRAFWTHRLDLNMTRERIGESMREIAGLRISCAVLFSILFAVIPFSTMFLGVSRLIIPGAIGMILLAVPITMEFLSIHRRRYPLLKFDRITHAIKMLLCPPVAIRAPDLLMAKATSGLDSLALASVLLKGGIRRQFLANYIRDLRHTCALEQDSELVAEACRWQNMMILEVARGTIPDVERILQEAGTGPVRESASCYTYCPRCFVQLTITAGTCPDCAGVPLKPFADVKGDAPFL